MKSARALAPYAGIIAFGCLSYLAAMHVNGFYSQILVQVLSWATAAAGVNITSGLGGSASLMQGAYYGLGAYGSAILLTHGVNFFLTLPAVCLMAAVLALAVGLLFARTRGQYFSIGTLFLGVVFTVLVTNLGSLTGGAIGMSVPAALSASQSVMVICAVLAAALALFRWVSRHRLGRRLTSVRDDETLSSHLGVPAIQVKVTGFVLAGVVGAAAGAAYGQFYGSLAPTSFTYLTGFLMFVAVGVGGPGTLFGPLLGCALIMGLPPALNIANGATMLVVGVIFVVVTILVPRGLTGILEDLWRHRPRAVRPPGPPERRVAVQAEEVTARAREAA
jgi:branched-chain amino acid transport system permease protein